MINGDYWRLIGVGGASCRWEARRSFSRFSLRESPSIQQRCNFPAPSLPLRPQTPKANWKADHLLWSHRPIASRPFRRNATCEFIQSQAIRCLLKRLDAYTHTSRWPIKQLSRYQPHMNAPGNYINMINGWFSSLFFSVLLLLLVVLLWLRHTLFHFVIVSVESNKSVEFSTDKEIHVADKIVGFSSFHFDFKMPWKPPHCCQAIAKGLDWNLCVFSFFLDQLSSQLFHAMLET